MSLWKTIGFRDRATASLWVSFSWPWWKQSFWTERGENLGGTQDKFTLNQDLCAVTFVISHPSPRAGIAQEGCKSPIWNLCPSILCQGLVERRVRGTCLCGVFLTMDDLLSQFATLWSQGFSVAAFDFDLLIRDLCEFNFLLSLADKGFSIWNICRE